MFKYLSIAFVASLLSATVMADGYGKEQFSSGVQQVALIELYTSEGCSSCPPADRWMSKLTNNARLWKDYVPIALHVDYWNYIGWRDRFSSKKYSDRQREYVRNGGARVSYTPGFFSNGKEWRGWYNGDALVPDRQPVGNLSVSLDGRNIAARFDPAANIRSDLVLNIAIVGMQIETDVRAGENRGKKLRHDFVALDLRTVRMERTEDAYKAITEISATELETDNLALVAWVAERNRQTPLQSVGGYI